MHFATSSIPQFSQTAPRVSKRCQFVRWFWKSDFEAPGVKASVKCSSPHLSYLQSSETASKSVTCHFRKCAAPFSSSSDQLNIWTRHRGLLKGILDCMHRILSEVFNQIFKQTLHFPWRDLGQFPPDYRCTLIVWKIENFKFRGSPSTFHWDPRPPRTFPGEDSDGLESSWPGSWKFSARCCWKSNSVCPPLAAAALYSWHKPAQALCCLVQLLVFQEVLWQGQLLICMFMCSDR